MPAVNDNAAAAAAIGIDVAARPTAAAADVSL
jgi:hypothetical protein